MSRLDDFHHALVSLRATPWALAPAHAVAVSQTIAELAAGRKPSAYSAAPSRTHAAVELVPSSTGKRVAIVSARGLVLPDIDFQPFAFSARRLMRDMQELSVDQSVSAVVVVMDSPGGTCCYTPEAADALYHAAIVKPVHVAVETLCASAAYFIASGATSISCLPSATGVGSIGVRTMHADVSRQLDQMGVKVTQIHAGEHKIEGNPFQPLSAEAKARYQLECETIHDGFINAVARGREVSAATVRANYGKGRVLMPAEAKRVGMIDALELPEAVIGRAISSANSNSSRKRAVGSAGERERLRAAIDIAAR